MNKQLRALLFDLNRVGEDFDSYRLRVPAIANRMASHSGVIRQLRIDGDAIAAAVRKFQTIVGNDVAIHYPEFWRDVVCDAAQKPIALEQTLELYRDYLDAYQELMPLFPDYERALRTAKSKSIKVGVIANGNTERIYRFLNRHKLTTIIDCVYTSGGWPFAKPDPRIFQLALNNLRVSPEEAAFVGDRLDNDIAGAQGVGMWAIHLRRQPDDSNGTVRADFQVSNLDDLWSLPLWGLQATPKVAVIPCGGRGERMGSVTQDTQKCLVRIGDAPILEQVMLSLARHGVKNFHLLAGYRSTDVDAFAAVAMRKNPTLKIVVHKQDARSTGDYIAAIADQLPDSFFYHHGNILLDDATYSDLIKAYANRGSTTLLITEDHRAPTHPAFVIRDDRPVEVKRNRRATEGEPGLWYSVGCAVVRTRDLPPTEGAGLTFEEHLAKGPSFSTTHFVLLDRDWFHLEREADIEKGKSFAQECEFESYAK